MSVSKFTLRDVTMHPHRSIFLIVLLAICLPASIRAQVDEVDPTIGNVSILLEPTRPTSYLPNSMVRMYPVRKDALDDQIGYFPLTILSHRQPELFAIMPGSSDGPAAYDRERPTPYYYSVYFDASMIHTEFSPSHQAGYFRFSFADNQASVTIRNLHAGSLHAIGKDALSGEESVMGMTTYVYGEFSAPVAIETSRTENRDSFHISAQTKTIDFRYGVSFISVEQAGRIFTAIFQLGVWTA